MMCLILFLHGHQVPLAILWEIEIFTFATISPCFLSPSFLGHFHFLLMLSIPLSPISRSLSLCV